MRWVWVLAAVVALSCVAAFLPNRTQIPPHVSTDYAYMLIGADRLYDGLGYTSLLPVAPLQPWDWQYDWGYLTQWPMGYPLVVVAVRWLCGGSTIEACRWISAIACAAALVGWFVWLWRNTPGGISGALLAAAGAGCCVSAALLLNPSTDALLIAGLPFVLLSVSQTVEQAAGKAKGFATGWLMLAGVAAGGLVWIRYAAVFIPIAIGLYLLIEWLIRRRIRFHHMAVFGAGAVLPIGVLLLLNRLWADTGSVQEQLNLGHRFAFDLSLTDTWRAWWRFTDLGYYDYHWYSHWVFALWPAGLLGVGLVTRSGRRVLRSMAHAPGMILSGAVVLGLFVVLLGTTAVFGDKFNYVDLDRYYQPVRPLYFLLFVSPLLWLSTHKGLVGYAHPTNRVLGWAVKMAVCIGLLTACSWTVQQDWPRPYQRWLAGQRERTPYGAWAFCLGPGADQLYQWLCQEDNPDLIVLSNFHDYIALETGIAALPLPPDESTLLSWLERVCHSRGIADPQVLFILDPDNKWRDYYLPASHEVVEGLGLTPYAAAPADLAAGVFKYEAKLRMAARR